MVEGRTPRPRRVGVLDASVIPSPRVEVDAPPDLLAVLDELADLIRSGAFAREPADGVLVDATVGSVRCLLVHVRESVSVDLSPREQQIALMVANGRTNQAIAGALEISVWTVSTHLRRIFAKLAVSSRAEMVAHLLGHPDYATMVDPGAPDSVR
jgi:DNA-binding CsgD family transcriptional regulator